MKTIVVKCDYCKTEIKENDPNTIVDGKGYMNILLTNEPHPSPETHGRKAILKIKLRSTTNKNLERDICPNCFEKCLKAK